MEYLVAYQSTVAAVGTLAALMLIQLLVADVFGILAKHKPGTVVQADPSDRLFRASRVVGNTNESIAIFILALTYGVFVGASPQYIGYCAWGFVLARTAYAACYYLDLRLMRSAVFGVSLLIIAATLITGYLTSP